MIMNYTTGNKIQRNGKIYTITHVCTGTMNGKEFEMVTATNGFQKIYVNSEIPRKSTLKRSVVGAL